MKSAARVEAEVEAVVEDVLLRTVAIWPGALGGVRMRQCGVQMNMDTDGVATPGREPESEPAWSKSRDSTRTYEHGMSLDMTLQDDVA